MASGPDIASLGLEIRSDGVVVANKRLRETEQQAKRTEKASERLEKRAQRMEQSMGRLGRTMSTRVTAPLLAMAAASVKMASDFESAMTRMNTLVGLSRQEIAGFRAEILALAPEVGRGPTELANALFAVTSAGQRGAAAMETLTAASKASAIGLGNTRDIALAATAAVTAYGEENLSSTEAVETLIGTVEQGNLEASDLASTLGRVVGLAAETGTSLRDAGAFIAAFTRQGVDAAQAVTGLRGVLTILVRKPTAEMERAFEEMGMSVEGFKQQVQDEGFIRSFQELVNNAQESGISMGRIIPEVEALTGALSVFASEGGDAAGIADSIGNALGTLEERLRAAEELDPSLAFAKMRAELSTMSVQIGNDILPALLELMESIKSLTEGFRELDPETQKTIVKTAGLVAAIGPALIALSALSRSLRALKGAYLILGGPISAVIASIGTLTGLYISHRNEIENLREPTDRATDALERMREATEGYLGTENVAQFEEALQDLNAEIDRTESKLDRLASKQEARLNLGGMRGEAMDFSAGSDAAGRQALEEQLQAQENARAALQARMALMREFPDEAERNAEMNRRLGQAVNFVNETLGTNINLGQQQAGIETNLMAVVGGVTQALDKERKAQQKVNKAKDEAVEKGEEQIERLTEELAMWGMNEAEALRFEAALIELNDTYGDASDEVAELLRGKADLIDADNDAAEAADKEAEAQDRLNQRLSEQQALLDRLNPEQARISQFAQDIQTLFNARLGGGAGNTGNIITNITALFQDLGVAVEELTGDLERMGGGGRGRRGRPAFGEDGVLVNTGRSEAAGGGGAEALLMEGLARAQQQAASILLQEFGGSGPGAQIGEAFGSAFGLIPQIAGNLIGDFIDDMFGSGAPDFPTFNIQSSQPSRSALDQSRDTVFGGAASGTVFNVDENQIREIMDAIVQFDRQLAQVFDPSDFDAITASLEAFDETFEDSAANAEEVMRRRFIAALDAAEPAVSEFVQSFGDLESMKAALAGIESIRDSLDDFNNVLLAMGDPADQITSRLIRMQQGIEAADTAMEQALFSEDPQAIAQAGQDLQQAILEKFELEKRLIEDLQDQLRSLELSGRQFRADIAGRIADLGGPREAAQLARVTGENRQAARQDVLNADDTEEALRGLDRFVDATDEWLDAARQRVLSLRDAELDRINNQLSALESEEEEILARGRERAQASQRASQAASQAIQQARQAELAAINEQLEQARAWESVLDSTRQMIDDLTFSQTNPASRFSRLDQLNQRIGEQDTSTPEGAREMQELLQRRLDLGQQLFQRGSPEFESLFNDTMSRLSEIEDKAQSEAQIANDLQRQANALQSQTNSAISSSSRTNIQLSAAEQRRLEEIRDEQADLQAEAQKVREDAEEALGRIDERARDFYQWAMDQREKLEDKRHEELMDQLHTITGGMPADLYIAKQQDKVVELLGFINDDLSDFLKGISGGSSDSNTSPGGSGDSPGEPGPNNPVPQSGPTINITVQSTGDTRKDARRVATLFKRELKTA